jgi:hypothetical protein
MAQAVPPPPVLEASIDAVRALAEELTKLVWLARTLVDANREVDLTGLDREVGLLCAKSLDLPQDEGRRMRPRLLALFGSVGELSRAIAARGSPSR